jgi:cell division septal protein FtsQ
MDIVKEREIIRLWNRLRLLERKGQSTTAVRRQIEKALEDAA